MSSCIYTKTVGRQSRESVIVSNPGSAAAPQPAPDQRPKAKPVSKKDQKKAPRQVSGGGGGENGFRSAG